MKVMAILNMMDEAPPVPSSNQFAADESFVNFFR